MAVGGDRPWPQVPVGNADHTQAAVVIIGAGISGLCTAIDLLKRNNCKNFIILEKSGGPGGTWRDNKYPGCCCDVWSHLYSFSFEQNPDWTREYPGQEEILQYIIGVAQKYELYRYIRFNTTVDEARWDAAEKKWKTQVTVTGAKDAEFGKHHTLTSDFLVSAVGQLNQPKMPNIPGIDDFLGKLMHSSRWDWSHDLQGKKIAIIGNGATAAQIIPELAKVAAKLTIHQRTPNWVVPRADAPIPAWRRALFKYVPPIRWRYRADMMDFREAVYDGVIDKNTPFADLLVQMSKGMMKAQLPDRPEVYALVCFQDWPRQLTLYTGWEKLTPNYAVGCKRVIVSDDYFPVFNMPHVGLETRKISKITPKGIEIDGVETAYDPIVCATGFRTVEFMHPIKITGLAGRSLSDIWSGGARALYAMVVESLPNFAMLYGPNGNLGHNSIILMIEAQSRYINALIKEVLRAKMEGKSLTITPTEERVEEYNKTIQKVLQNSSFADPNCTSWYKDEKTGLITNNWSGTVIDYQKMVSKVDWSDYSLSGSGAEGLGEGKTTNIGRVVEETMVSYQTMGLTAVSLLALAVAAGLALRNSGRLRLR